MIQVNLLSQRWRLNYLEIPPDPVKVVAVVVTVVVVAVTCGAAAPLGAMIIGLVVGVALELVMQVTVMGVAPENINWTKVAISGAIGAVSGAAGSYISGIGKTVDAAGKIIDTTSKVVKAVRFGLHALATGLSGGITGAAYAWIDTGSWDWAAFGIGFATGFAIYCGTQALAAVSKAITNKIRYVKVTELDGNIAYLRRSAVRQAWKQEQTLVKLTGQGTNPNWTKIELDELLKTGKIKGYVGHHINNVADFPALAGNPNNIRFLTPQQHLYDDILGHGGNWKNKTTGELIDRLALIFGGK